MKKLNYLLTLVTLLMMLMACDKNEVENQSTTEETDKYEIISQKADSQKVKEFIRSHSKNMTRMGNTQQYNEILLEDYNLETVFTTNKELYDGALVESYLSNDHSKILVITKYDHGNTNTIFELKMNGTDDRDICVTKYDFYNAKNESFSINLNALSTNPLTAIDYTTTRPFLGKNACDWAIYASGAAWVAGATLAASSAGTGFLICAAIGLGFDYMASTFCHYPS